MLDKGSREFLQKLTIEPDLKYNVSMAFTTFTVNIPEITGKELTNIINFICGNDIIAYLSKGRQFVHFTKYLVSFNYIEITKEVKSI